MNLTDIKATRSGIPPRTLIYGPHKIGKSTFASQAPAPIFIQTEDGLDSIDSSAFPLCKTWADVMACISALYEGDHGFQTVVLDSADWAEKLAQEQVCSDHDVKSIEKIGYGKGYSFAADIFRECLDGLGALRTQRNMGVVLLAHSEIRRFDDPMSDAYDRYQVKLSKLVGKMIQEWADVIGFAQLDTIVKSEKTKMDATRHRAVSTGDRVLRLTGGPAFDAGNRYGLPDSIPLIWSNYQAALDAARTVKE
jgi:hypothetical protein